MAKAATHEAGGNIELPSRGSPATTLDTVDVAVTEQYPTGFRFIILTLGLILSIFLSALDSSIISTAIPSITSQFGTVADVGWYASGYAIMNAAFQATWGKAYKYFSIKITFLLAILVFEIGNTISATAQTSTAMIVGRVVSGIGGGGVMSGSFIVIALSAKPQYRAAYMGVLGVTFGCASVAGPLLGGILTDGPGWRFCFWISLPIGFVAAIIMFLAFRQPATSLPAQVPLKEKIISLDIAGSMFSMTALICFVLATQLSTYYGWSSWRTILPFTSFGVLVLLFTLNEWYMGSRAMIQTHFLKSRRITLNLFYQFFLAGLFFPLTYALPIQFQSVGNISPSQSGIRLIPLILGVSVFTMVANGILTFWKHYTPFLVLGAVAGTIGVIMVHQLSLDAKVASWIGFEILTASGVGLALQVPMIANQAAVGTEDIASVTSLTLFCENIGTALFIAATEAAFTNGLMGSLKQNVRGVDPETVVNTGATEIRTAFGKDQVPEILMSYLQGCRDSHWVPIACGLAAVAVSTTAGVPGLKREWQTWRKKGGVS